jgi:hypothetical protein
MGWSCYLQVCVYPFKLLNQLTNFHAVWYERYAIAGHPNLVICKKYILVFAID